MNVISPGSSRVVYDGAVVRDDLDVWNAELQGMFARTRSLFYRTESKKHAEQYMLGLLSTVERKNGWTIAEHAGELEPKALQRFLNLSPWDAEALRDRNRDYAMDHFADSGGILVADPTGFGKKGYKSVGTQRQYSGTLGRVDNCQIATFLCYVTSDRDRVLLDRRLYMPQSWTADPVRCAEAGVPADVTFKTRPEQVRDMIDSARQAGVPFAWFTADEEFGQNPGLCDYLQNTRTPYVMAVPKNTQFTDSCGTILRCDTRAERLPRNAWSRRACGIGLKGPRVYDWALIDSADPEHRYMIRRSITDDELAFYHCYDPHRAGFGELVYVAGARWPIEECFGSGKNETGLDHYQVRTWDAWHRHITLSMLTNTFLAITASKAKKGDTTTTRSHTKLASFPTAHPSRIGHRPSIEN
jgi:SRSO17 transposase